jgi:CubicO group peptidase (beta-lactamase class C family)
MQEFLAGVYRPDEPGAAVLVQKNGATLLRAGFGMANAELGVRIEPSMVFRLGSVTKQFTAMAVLMLAQEGKLGLDDPLTKYLPGYPIGDRTITVSHLLAHTSGIRSYTALPGFVAGIGKDYTHDELVALFSKEPFDFNPGERFLYNNSGYFLLGMIIEKASGEPYEQFLRRRIFQPLGMSHSGYGFMGPVVPGRAAGYDRDPNGMMVNTPWMSMTQPYSAGALVSSVDDLALWDAALYTDTLLSAPMRERMFTSFTLNSAAPTGYGCGWSLGELQGVATQEHGGGINGFSTHVLRIPSEKIYVAVLSNNTGASLPAGAVARNLAARAMGKPLEEKKVAAIDPVIVDAYVGDYELAPGFILTISREGGRFFAQATGQSRAEIFPQSETEFFLKVVPASLTFVREADGKVSELVLHQNGDRRARRIR